MDTFYDDQNNNNNNIKLLKNRMTLDFNQPVIHDKKSKLKTCILESPDLKMLKLASPELERMIIQQNGMVTTTPTPSATLPYFLKSEPTEEQEQYARGFVDALNQLHQSNGQSHGLNKCAADPNNNHNNNQNHNPNQNPNPNPIHSQNNSHHQNLMSSDSSSDLTLAELNGRRNSFHNNPVTCPQSAVTSATGPKFVVPTITSTSSSTEHYVSVSSCQTNGAHVLINHTRSNAMLPPYSQAVTTSVNPPMPIKVEPQVMQMSPPMVGPLSPTQGLAQPIDMADQERIKLERKRLRNRIAASKCRKRKLERISRLEEKVRMLKGENSELSVVVNKLRDQACSLKQQIMDHVKCGCQLMVPQ